jgi:hypothetical protein
VSRTISQSVAGRGKILAVAIKPEIKIFTCTSRIHVVVVSTQGAYNDSKNGAGLGANARITLFKQVDFGLHALGGNGVGRYGTSSLPEPL